jgi:tetratricopeptide (TPR) repeat protein
MNSVGEKKFYVLLCEFLNKVKQKMATRKKTKKQQEETLVDITEVRAQAQGWFEQNQTMILSVVAAIVIIVGGLFAYKNLYQIPRNIEAQEQMFQAEFMFGKDSFQLALNNPGGGFDGFLGIIDKYGSTKAGNMAKYYAGICYLNLGDMDKAIEHLNSFSAKGGLMPIMKNGTLGDAYADKDQMDKALSYYEKAIKAGDDQFLTPYYLKKAGVLSEMQGDYKSSLKAFQAIKDKYPNSSDGQNIDKYIARVNARL